MDQDEKLLAWLSIQSERTSFHGDKIWEVMKHFSWILYLLLSAPFILKDLGDMKVWLPLLPFLAVIAASFAILSICKESKEFLDALGTVLSIEERLGFHNEETDKNPKMLVSQDRKNKLKGHGSIDDFKNGKLPILCRYTTSVRKLFLAYFMILFLIGIAELWFLMRG